MVDTDWREILSYSQKELLQADKDKLCENLSWMDVDDIELNFSDLKTLFRLSQDILKYKSEQVNNLLGQLETSYRKGKQKIKGRSSASPTKNDVVSLETIANQEEEIKANKEILEQLYHDIAELEGRKNKIVEKKQEFEKESESSRDTLSEMNAIVELENELAMKNKHIRKLLNEIKVIEDESSTLKEKIVVLKDKLTEATQIINNLTEQLVCFKTESTQLKDIIGKLEQEKNELSVNTEALRKQLFEKESTRENIYEEIKSKVQHWKTAAKTKKAEVDALLAENNKLKEDLNNIAKPPVSPKKSQHVTEHEIKIKELQDKLSEAAKEIEQSASIIVALKVKKKQLKSIIEELQDHSISDIKNQSDEGKERIIISKLKKKIKVLILSLQAAEELIVDREKELADIVLQLQTLQSDEGIEALIQGLKNKTRQIRIKDEGIKNLVRDVNTLNIQIEDLQLQNESLRQICNLPPDQTISTAQVKNKFHDIEKHNKEMFLELRKFEDQVVNLELENRNMRDQINRMTKILNEFGYKENTQKNIINEEQINKSVPYNSIVDGQIDHKTNKDYILVKKENVLNEEEIKTLIEENEGLRKGLQEILEYLKDNSTTSSGILALQCPSLENLLQSMEARHTCGWFAPHMAVAMELKSAQGGKDALLVALHEARKETYDVMSQLTQEVKHSSELKQKLIDMEIQSRLKDEELLELSNTNICEFGSWVSESDVQSIDLYDKQEIENVILRAHNIHEGQLKNGLQYFHKKFKLLFDKITAMSIKAVDNSNKWYLQEENYKAEIENLKAQLEDEDFSDKSPGLLPNVSTTAIQKKLNYLEESYTYIRTVNENIKKENIEIKKEALLVTADYENQIQKLILAVTNLTGKLRSSIPLAYFWKQNEELYHIVSKYRNYLEKDISNLNHSTNLSQCFQTDIGKVIGDIQARLPQNGMISQEEIKQIVQSIIESTFQKQYEELFSSQITMCNTKIKDLEDKNRILQDSQSKIIDDTLSSITNKEIDLLKGQLKKLGEENQILKEQCQHVNSQLEIALMELQNYRHHQLNYDMEINLLRHQILDLQSTSDSKAVIARLSGEALIAHMQASESHQKIESLSIALNKERQRRMETEDLLESRQKIFDVYTFRYEKKFKYMHEIIQILRQQYHGSIPLISIENYLNTIEDLNRKTHAVNEKLIEIENMRSNLMAKHSTYDQILEITKNKCSIDEYTCQHKLNLKTRESLHSRELEYLKCKLETAENTRIDVIKQCNHLHRTVVLLNQAFNETSSSNSTKIDNQVTNVKLEDAHSDDEQPSRKSATITLPKPQILKPVIIPKTDVTSVSKVDIATETLIGSPLKSKSDVHIVKVCNVQIQTTFIDKERTNQFSQTDASEEITHLTSSYNHVRSEYNKLNKELEEAVGLLEQKTQEVGILDAENSSLHIKLNNLKTSCTKKDSILQKLQETIEIMKEELFDLRNKENAEKFSRENANENDQSLLSVIKQLELDRNNVALEYKELLKNERDEYSKSLKGLNIKIMELQTQLDRKGSDDNASNAEAFKEVIGKYTLKVAELEDKCFKLQSELDESKSDLQMYQGEVERWKNLATERLNKMEQLNSQLKERHCHELASYKAENDHWLLQLSETQREHMELRTQLTEQKTEYVKQLAEKDSHIEQLRTVIQNLKAQVMNLQTMLSANDPSFDLSAIVEVEEGSDASSPQGCDRLELKFGSNHDSYDSQEDFFKIPESSTTIWQEPIIERLRRDKQLTGKQNAMLRRQIKALAARERRARLDAQNLKNQLFRISTTGNKVVTAETAALHNKIATLQAQLMNVRRDSQSSVALWDKWKRAQQASERWQARYEDKCQEVKRLESNLNLAKSGITRLEKEKRVLMTRISEIKSESQSTLEKQEAEPLEKKQRVTKECACNESPVSSQALLERVKSQQRRIVALEAAEKGNEHLVSEYEKSLAEITSLKGQVLKLESTILESQIRSPFKSDKDNQPEIDYWKSYCDMLKDENVQLTLKLNSLETIPATAHQQRISDLEQTVLTLRGLVSKLQAEQKSSGGHKKGDSRPSSGRTNSEKNLSQLESHRIEIANLKRSMQDKDLLLERSKEMLKIAAEREDELLRENALLRRRIEMLTETSGGFLSA